MKNKCLAIAVLIFALGACLNSTAQPTMSQQSADYASSLRDATKRTWKIVLQKDFANAASSPEEADLIRKTRLYVDDFADINGWAKFDQKSIHLELGMIFVMNDIADAMLYIQARPDLYPKLIPYINKLSELSIEGQKEGYSKAMPGFWEYAHMSLSEAQSISSEADYGDKKAGLMCELLAFVVGHEVGHIVYHHLPYDQKTPEQARLDEAQADQYGYRIAKKAGYHPWFGSMTIFYIFANLENGQVDESPSATHPSAVHRIRDLFAFVLDDISALPDSAFQPPYSMPKEQELQQLRKLQQQIDDLK
jgi:peptidoglycan/xylan/chitin deacetylase (PgdA/CDA1 family)